jgi:hypothetical protein
MKVRILFKAADLVFRKLSNKNGDIINKFIDLIKSETDLDNEKIKPFTKNLSIIWIF